MNPVEVQIVAYAPTLFYHCQHCELVFQETGFGRSVHREQAEESLPEDLKREFEDVSVWLHSMARRHGHEVNLRLVDAASIEGFWKSFRHRIRRYPAVIVDGRVAGDWADLERVNLRIEEAVAARTGAPERLEGEGRG